MNYDDGRDSDEEQDVPLIPRGASFPEFCEAKPRQEEEEEKLKAEEEEEEEEKQKAEEEEEEEEAKKKRIYFKCDVCGEDLVAKTATWLVKCPKCSEASLPKMERQEESGNLGIVIGTKKFMRCPCNCLVVQKNSQVSMLGSCPRCSRVLMFASPQEGRFYCLCSNCDRLVTYGLVERKCCVTSFQVTPFRVKCSLCKQFFFLRRKGYYQKALTMGLSTSLTGFLLLILSSAFFGPSFPGISGLIVAFLLLLWGGTQLVITIPFLFAKEAEHFDFDGKNAADSLSYLSQKKGFQPNVKRATPRFSSNSFSESFSDDII